MINKEINQVSNKLDSDISSEWDSIASYRIKQIEESLDLSYQYILVPSIEKLLENCDLENVIDVGCGIGHLTYLISQKAKKVTGIDLSPKSIEIAKSNFSAKNITYLTSSIENYSSNGKNHKHSLVVANMFLMDTLYLKKSVFSISNILKRKKNFIFSITHPWFWAFYWGYMDKPWFDYKKEIIIEGDFQISLDRMKLKSTHVHRPLEKYINVLSDSGFILDKIYEPIPNPEIQKKYPKHWDFPRFLIGSCSKK